MDGGHGNTNANASGGVPADARDRVLLSISVDHASINSNLLLNDFGKNSTFGPMTLIPLPHYSLDFQFNQI
ncbi:unnamed protein product [Cuscuta epithymum]|uniref:Uncharacterized protein n=1 Tax=Cuscuta epithymum TaxID=186058 RepID=A0AAV0FCZ8_9ASTE|nr:unnamed protein product [Cuscuta epithymum]